MEENSPAHPWKARLLVALIMLILGCFGLIIADVHKDGALLYWKYMTPLFGLLAIGLSWYLRRNAEEFHLLHLLQEVGHWATAVGAVYLLNMFVSIGIMGRFDAALAVNVTLALTTCLAGIYIESTLVVIGIVLALFAGGVALASEYLYSLMIPTFALALVILYFIVRKKKV